MIPNSWFYVIFPSWYNSLRRFSYNQLPILWRELSAFQKSSSHTLTFLVIRSRSIFLVTFYTIYFLHVSAASLTIRSFLQFRSHLYRSRGGSGRLLDDDVRSSNPGLSLRAAQSLGMRWIGAGLRASQLVGGIDTECDGVYFDNATSIDEKVKHA